ncbi:MAG: alpha/beta fold hydrolase [Candidatus Berkiellales bacterium]
MPFLSLPHIQLYYEVHGSGAPLLLLHGLGSSTLDWENQLEFFSKKYQVIAFDLRGHGQSAKPDEPYTVKLFAEDTAELIRTLIKESTHVVGHSLGGMIAFQLVLDFPELVKSLCIINSAPAVIFPSLKVHFSFYLRRYIVKLFGVQPLCTKLAKNLFPKSTQAKLREIFIQRWSHNDPKAYVNSLNAFRHWNVIARLSEIACPTLIVTADHDYTPVSAKEFYVKLIKGAELKVIPDSWHMTIVDQPGALNQTMLNFLTKNFPEK